jgi:hypothetical protein
MPSSSRKLSKLEPLWSNAGFCRVLTLFPSHACACLLVPGLGRTPELFVSF